MTRTRKDPGADGAATGGESSGANDRTQVTASGAAVSAIAEGIRRYLAELAALDRWVVRNAEKVPLHPVNHKPASINDRATRCSLDRALSVWRANPQSVAGVGFVMTDVNTEHPELRLVGIDLDAAFDEFGALKPWAMRLIEAAGPCYWERSPSGQGLRGFMRGAIPSEMTRKFADGGIELYDGRSGRYLTVTGVRYVAA